MTRLTGSRRKRTVLLVEDDDDARLVIAEYFERVGYHVETARDGNDAISIALRVQPDVVVLDLMMPRLDGWETVRILRAYPTTRDIPLVAYTGTNEMGVTRATALGYDAIVRKPSSAAELEAVVSNVLGGGDEPEEQDAG